MSAHTSETLANLDKSMLWIPKEPPIPVPDAVFLAVPAASGQLPRTIPSSRIRHSLEHAKRVSIMERRLQVNEARRALLQKVAHTYGHRKTPSEDNFLSEVNQYGAVSLKLLLVYGFTLIYGSIYLVHNFTFGVDYIKRSNCDMRGTKEGPIVISNTSHMNASTAVFFHERLLLTNSSIFYNYFYGSMLNEVEDDGEYQANNSKICKIIPALSLREEFQFSVNNETWPSIIKLGGMYGKILSGFPVGLLSDIYGRKPAFAFASIIEVLGFLVILVPWKYALLIGEFLIGFGAISIAVLYVLVLEKCSNASFLWLGLLVFLCHPFTNFIAFILRNNIRSWRLLHVANTTMFLILPFGIWYIVESPRWLRMVGDIPAAWKALKRYGVDEPDNTDLNMAVAPRPTMKKVLENFCLPIYRDRITTCIVFYILCAISLYVNKTTVKENFHLGGETFLLILTTFQVLIYMFSYTIAITFGRRRSLFVLHCIVSILDLVVFMENQYFQNTITLPLLLYGHVAAAHAVVFIVMFYTMELFPTPFRATAMGISVSAFGIGETLQQEISQIFHPASGSVAHMPAFVGSITCALAITFLPVTSNSGLPDTPAEALYLRIFV